MGLFSYPSAPSRVRGWQNNCPSPGRVSNDYRPDPCSDLTLGLRYRTTSTRKPCDRSPNASPAIVSGYPPGFTSSRSARGDEETGKRRIDALNRSCQDLNNLNSTGCYPSPGILAISKFERGRNRTRSAATARGMPSITASPS